MIIVQLLGGLGNQLFQYGAGRSLSLRYQVPLKFDISRYDKFPDRHYRLDQFNIAATIATGAEIALQTGKQGTRLARRLHQLGQWLRPGYRRSVFVQQGAGYDPNFERVRGNAYLVGYWQSYRYFQPIVTTLRRDLSWRRPPAGLNQKLYEQIGAVEGISLHVRRGDYVTDPIANQHHGVCSLAYYETAVSTLLQTIPNPHFFIFSDDIPWVKANLQLPAPATFVDHNGADHDYEDLRLMAHCRHHIIANSSFSWWGAWLCPHPDKQVIAPQQWYANPARNADDMIPPDWQRL